MNRSITRRIGIAMLFLVMTVAMLTGCGGQKLSDDFDVDDVKAAAENVITILNRQDSDALLELCTVQMREALTEDVLRKVYEGIGEGGTYIGIEDIRVGGITSKQSEEEFAVVVAKAKYEIKKFTYTITFTKQMKLAGLYYR
jgi:hypothetical protein